MSWHENRAGANRILKWVGMAALGVLAVSCGGKNINTALPADMEALGGGTATVKQVIDLDQIVLDVSGKPAVVRAANLLPLHKWPADLTDKQKNIRAEVEAGIRTMLVGQQVSLSIVEPPTATTPAAVDIQTGGAISPGPIHRTWEGNLPSEQRANFIFDLNTEMVQMGYSPFVSAPTRVSTTELIFREAEENARRAKLGIWADADLGANLGK